MEVGEARWKGSCGREDVGKVCRRRHGVERSVTSCVELSWLVEGSVPRGGGKVPEEDRWAGRAVNCGSQSPVSVSWCPFLAGTLLHGTLTVRVEQASVVVVRWCQVSGVTVPTPAN